MKDGFSGECSIVLPQITIEMEQNDPLVSSLHITDIGYYPHAESHFRERLQPISEYVLIYCMDGEGWFKLEEQEYKVRANQFFILPPNRPHTYGADKDNPWTIYWIHFTGSHAAIYSENSQVPMDIRPALNSKRFFLPSNAVPSSRAYAMPLPYSTTIWPPCAICDSIALKPRHRRRSSMP